MDDNGCICKGNWRDIVKDTEHLIGEHYRHTDGAEYVLFGIVHGGDDYYYGMCSNGGLDARLLSCVGSIEGYGYTLVVPNAKVSGGGAFPPSA